MIALRTGDQICSFCLPKPDQRLLFCHGKVSAAASVVFGCLLFSLFSGLIKIDDKQHISPLYSVFDPGARILSLRVPLKNKALPPDRVGVDGSSRDNWCCAWGCWGFPGDAWI